MVDGASSGVNDGEGRSAAGISTSIEPTVCSPVYAGNAGIGLREENQEDMMSGK